LLVMLCVDNLIVICFVLFFLAEDGIRDSET